MLFILFGIFIIGCGLSHLVGAIEFFWPIYHIGLVINIVTALASAFTAYSTYPAVKNIMQWKTPEEVADIHKQYETIAYLTLKGILVFDEDNKIIESNKVCEKLLGYSSEELLGKNVLDYLKIDISSLTDSPIENELLIERKDTSKFYASLLLSYLFFKNKKIYLVVIRDIDHRKRNELQIKLLNEALRLRVQTLEQFNYMVAHDLNAPLRSLEGFSEILLQDYSSNLDAAGIDYLNRIYLASKRMRNLITDMIKLSRITTYDISIQPDKINLTELFKEVNKKYELDNSGRKYEVIIEDNLECVGDINLIRLLIDNLLNNAWKFTSKKPVTKIYIGKLIKDDKIIFYVKDNGAGFDQSKSDKLFKPFERLHSLEDFHGNGIGLTIVKRVIDLHNGQIWGEGVVGEGATFYFNIGDKV